MIVLFILVILFVVVKFDNKNFWVICIIDMRCGFVDKESLKIVGEKISLKKVSEIISLECEKKKRFFVCFSNWDWFRLVSVV